MAGRAKRRRSRRLLLLALIAAAGVWFFFDQQNRIQTQEIPVSAAGLPAAFEGLRIAQISDLHGKQFGEGNGRLLERVAEGLAIRGSDADRCEEQINRWLMVR